MYKVIKRDGKEVDFNVNKISNAIGKAFAAVGRDFHPSVVELLALRTCADFETKVKDGLRAIMLMWLRHIFFIVNKEKRPVIYQRLCLIIRS